jgi:hypothetical protein
MVEVVPLPGILFWLQQVRLKKASSVTRLEIKQEQLLHINILLQIEVEVVLARTHSGAGARRHSVRTSLVLCGVRRSRVKELRGTEMAKVRISTDYLSRRL